jgi:hypothetical protein
LAELFKSNAKNLKTYICTNHANSHGICKGSATAMTSGMMLPPPTSSIAAWGEWSLGQILDIYWHFAEPGDYYLGRCLSGFDPNSPDFVCLPPHFTVGNPMEHPQIWEAIKLMYRPELNKWGGTKYSDPTALLCKLLPLVVYHSEFLKETIRRVPGHTFSGVPLLNNPALLRDLKEFVMLERSAQVMTPTGIPPHIHHATLTTRCIDLCQMTLTEVKNMAIEVRKAVSNAFEEKAFQNRIVMTQTLAEMFKEHHKKMDELITTRLAVLQEAGGGLTAAATVNKDENQEPKFAQGDFDGEPTTATTPAVYRTYTHSGRF